MDGSCALYAENKILEHLVGKAEFTMPATPYLALFTVAPTGEDGTGGTEIVPGAGGNNYNRLALTAATYWKDAAADGAIDNSDAIEFPEATSANWGNIKAFAIYNHVTETTEMLIWGNITTPKDIDIGDTAKFAAGELVITLD